MQLLPIIVVFLVCVLKVRGQTKIDFLSYTHYYVVFYVQLGVCTISWEKIMFFLGKMYIDFLRKS